MLLRVPGAGARRRWRRDLREAFANEFVGIRNYRRSEDQIGENLTRAENYLSLVGLVVLILGGIGVSSVTRVFVQQKVRSIAILKCIGSTSSQVLGVYMTQVLLLGLAGSVLGRGAWPPPSIAAVPSLVGDLAAMLPGRLRADRDARSGRGWPSACWSRFCSRSCRCSRCGTSSRRCCCGRTSRRRRASTG